MGSTDATALVVVPDDLPEISPTQAEEMGFVPVDDATETELRQKAAAEVSRLVSMVGHPQDMGRAIESIAEVGLQQMESTGWANDLLNQRMPSFGGKQYGSTHQAEMSKNMANLHDILVDLDPNKANSLLRRFFRMAPGAKQAQRFVTKTKSADAMLRTVEKTSQSGEDTLMRDNRSSLAKVATMQDDLAAQSKNMVYLKELYTQLRERYVAATDDEKSELAGALYMAGQQYAAIQTDMAVTVQGIGAYRTLYIGNVMLLVTSRMARTTTIKALRTQAGIAIMADNQRRVYEQREALRAALDKAIAANGRTIGKQVDMIKKQATEPMLDFDGLRQSFAETLRGFRAIQEFDFTELVSMVEQVEAIGPEFRAMYEQAMQPMKSLEAGHAGAERAIER